MSAKQSSVWDRRYPYLFSVMLCAITVIGYLVMTIATVFRPSLATTNAPDSMMLPFLCFLPICFLLTANAFRDTQSKVEALEARIQELEFEKSHAEPLEVA